MYDEVEYVGDGTVPALFFTSPVREDGTRDHLYITMQTLADRMELYGLESVEQALEYLGRAAHHPEVEDGYVEGVLATYKEVAQAEFAQTLMPSPKVGEGVRQTLMAPMAIAPSKRVSLNERRSDALALLGMQSVVHSEPTVRMMDSSRPVERTRPAAAVAVDTSEEVIQKAVAAVQADVDVIQEWRVEALCAVVPQIRAELVKHQEEGN